MKNFFSAVWRGWKAFGRFMGDLVGRLFLMVFYLTIALPFGLGVRLFSDPLDIKGKKTPEWITRTTPEASTKLAQQQF